MPRSVLASAPTSRAWNDRRDRGVVEADSGFQARSGTVTWSEGTVRAPRQLPVLFGKAN